MIGLNTPSFTAIGFWNAAPRFGSATSCANGVHGSVDAGAFGLGRGRLRFGAADRGDAAFAARDALRRFVQIADRALAADRAVIGMRRLDAEPLRELLFRIAIAPAQEIDDVERLDLAEQLAAAVLFGALQRLLRAARAARGPAVISFGRSAISPTPTMTGMRSSDCNWFVIILVVTFSKFEPDPASWPRFEAWTTRELAATSDLPGAFLRTRSNAICTSSPCRLSPTPPPARSCARPPRRNLP